MASIVLSAAGAALGSSIPGVGPVIGSIVGRTLGSALGGAIDDAVFGVPTTAREGARLAELSVQVSTYGKALVSLFGTARMAGNIIWSRPIQETATTSTTRSGGGKGGGGARSSSTTYSYSVSLAISVCEGPIDAVLRVWADAKQLDLSQGTYRIHKGEETQLPDSYIESFEGAGKVPAYRGQAYLVIEDFPLADFGNRIPNFTFEVKRKSVMADVQGLPVENLVKSMIMIPGAGEFVYDTSIQQKISGEAAGTQFAQQGLTQPINQHTPDGTANALVSLQQLKETCANLEWVAVVVTWFGTSLDAAACEILPAVEYKAGASTSPESWSVGGYTRANARQMTLENGQPRYGGTPDDQSLLRYIDALKAAGYKVLLLPLFFMEVANKPWRGRVTGTATAVDNFFGKTNGYNAFITHYANLCAGRIDGFAIGSEMIGLTKVMGTPAGVFPAVNRLVTLAGTVRSILGGSVKLTYAADWSEYHHEANGWYNLDPLWASPNIDVIGIDGYFPLTDEPQSGITLEKIMAGWTSGEGYDWYYTDEARTQKAPLAPAYAWKNIGWFWSQPHVNPNGTTTAWVPASKKIWFTEYGFPSVDGATNQPNVFYDPSSSESFFPRFSRGQVDFRAQRLGIAATEAVWGSSSMVERRFLWTWDARPYPFYPDLRSVWADGDVWITGHWVTGKFGLSSLGAIVSALCRRAGLSESRTDVSRLTTRVEGYVVTRIASARQLIEELMSAYLFDAVESDGILRFIPRGEGQATPLGDDALLEETSQASVFELTRQQELELPASFNVLYLSRTAQYQTSTQTAYRLASISRDAETLNLPLVLSDAEARSIAQVQLYLRWIQRQRVQFRLDNRYAALEPTDVITLTMQGVTHTLRITRTLRDLGQMRVEAVAEDATLYRAYAPPRDEAGLAEAVLPPPATRLELLDIPALPGDAPSDATLRFAAAGLSAGWRGAVVYRSEDNGANYGRLTTLESGAILGAALNVLPVGMAGNRIDETAQLSVLLLGTEGLQSVSRIALLNGANIALVGDEILQFQSATEIAEGKYVLSQLLRARCGTEAAMSTHRLGERFVLLDARVAQQVMSLDAIGLPRQYKGVTVGSTLGSTTEQVASFQAVSLRPLPPVHIRGSRDAAGQLTLRWVRRARVQSNWRDAIDVPLDEAQESYQVSVKNGAQIVRRVNVASTEWIYSTTQQIADFGAVPSSVHVQVQQLSAVVGAGNAAERWV